MTSEVVILSGGLDSSVLLASIVTHLPRRYAVDVLAVSFDYGQRHVKELEAAAEIVRIFQPAARSLGGSLSHRVVHMPELGALLSTGGSSLVSTKPIPHGHYEHESMKATVVPNRNMIMLAIAGGIAMSEGATTLSYGAHAGDHAIYPDCRPAFVEAMHAALGLADWSPLALNVPFLDEHKSDIVQRGSLLNVPFEVTWSCYEGREIHCGLCGTCVERREAFSNAKVRDPTKYAA